MDQDYFTGYQDAIADVKEAAIPGLAIAAKWAAKKIPWLAKGFRQAKPGTIDALKTWRSGVSNVASPTVTKAVGKASRLKPWMKRTGLGVGAAGVFGAGKTRGRESERERLLRQMSVAGGRR
jgi:hypothetical protein